MNILDKIYILLKCHMYMMSQGDPRPKYWNLQKKVGILLWPYPFPSEENQGTCVVLWCLFLKNTEHMQMNDLISNWIWKKSVPVYLEILHSSIPYCTINNHSMWKDDDKKNY